MRTSYQTILLTDEQEAEILQLVEESEQPTLPMKIDAVAHMIYENHETPVSWGLTSIRDMVNGLVLRSLVSDSHQVPK